ncbi:MAG: DUF4982 domain-containing protein [Peptostreptococcaceae bacterium]|nr:DUF4982 domain-containing protein [Peptostreptococcaceae bacterium]
MKQLFMNNWKFIKTDVSECLGDVENKIESFEPVDLPHDWQIADTSDLYEDSIGWYTNTIHNKSASCLFIHFDGIYMDSTIYLNGKEVGTTKSGYESFSLNLTDFLKPEDNLLIIKVLFLSPNSRWYSGAGIYREVWIEEKNQAHFISHGVYLATNPITDDLKTWELLAQSEVNCHENYIIKHHLFDKNNNLVDSFEGESKKINNPLLWNLKTPNLYTLKSDLIVNQKVLDQVSQRFGFRSIKFDANKGFFLNSQHIKIKGVCNHHDFGALGSAYYSDAAKRQLSIEKEMGINAIRVNMPPEDLLNLCDELGIFIMSDSFDMWEQPKNKYDYARFFKDNYRKTTINWIKKDRNHPSVILWCIGNEIYDTHQSAKGQEITRVLYNLVKEYDPYENARVTMASNYMPWKNAQSCADIIKTAGYNYGEKYYKKHHKEHEDWIIFGSETASIVSSRGIYHFPLQEQILSDDDFQCSALGNSTTSWGARSLENCITMDRDTPFSLGQFLWSGFDYIGEPTPYHTRNSYLGQIDTAGFVKDSFFFFQSAWTDYKTKPMVHLLPYWDFNEGQIIDVRAYTNAPYVELFVNGISKGIQNIHWKSGNTMIGDWSVPYEKGNIKAIAYDQDKKIIATDIKTSFSDPKTIVIETSTTTLVASSRKLAFITITTKDKDGTLVENANNWITVKVENGILLGMDNGDSTDTNQYQTNAKQLFSGKLLAIVSANSKTGILTITANSPGLKGANLTIKVIENKQYHYTSLGKKLYQVNSNKIVPIRKIALQARGNLLLTNEAPSTLVDVDILPSQASFSDINFQITGPSGAEINRAEVTKCKNNPHQIRVTGKGDGPFILRATGKNGSDKVKIMSILNFENKGMGTLYKNPYTFISGSLYSSFTGDLGTGNERGVATARDAKTSVSYASLDFGLSGSDTITLPLFELESEPTLFTFREGTDLTDESKILGTFIYHKKSIWNVYQEETFTFNRRLKGITTLSIELEHKVHIKGFIFKKRERAFALNEATTADEIYGDSFTREEHSITQIGNNVSLIFQMIHFAENKIKSIIICGRSPIPQNSIHIKFMSEKKEYTFIAEFTYTQEYTEMEFPIDLQIGTADITFMFLPGSNFDFKWFQFVK